MKRIVPVYLVLLISGCGSAPGPTGGLDLTPDVASILAETQRQKRAAAAIVAEAPEAPPASAARITAEAANVTDAAGRIAGHATNLGGKQAGIDDLLADNEKLKADLVKARDDAGAASKRAQSWAWTLFLVIGGIGLVAGAAMFFLDKPKTATLILICAGACVAVGIVLPAIIAVAALVVLIVRIALIAVAAAAVGLLVWYVVVNRKELLARLGWLQERVTGIVAGIEVARIKSPEAAKLVTAEIGAADSTGIRAVVDPIKSERKATIKQKEGVT